MLHSIDRDLRLISVSDRWLEVLGYQREEVIGRRSTDFLTEESRQLAKTQILPEFLRTGMCKNVPYQFVHKDGSLIDVLLSAVAVRDASGELIRSVATSTEVTEIRQTQERLHAIESEYRALVEHVPAIVYTAAIEPAGKMLYVSPQIEQVLGFAPKEWVALPNAWRDAIHPEDRERILEIVQAPLVEHAELSMEYRLRSKDRRWVWVRDDRKVVIDERGVPLFIQGFAKDVTDRKIAEQALRASEERFRRIVDTALEGVWVLDAEANTIYVNRRLTEMLKYTAEEMLGRPMYEFMDPMEAATAQRLFERRRKGISEKHDFLFRCKDDSRIWTIVSSKPMFDDKLNFVGALGMITDITERKKAEMSLALSEALYRGVVEDQTELICRFLPNGTITFANEACCRFFRKKREQMIDRHLLQLFSSDNRVLLDSHLARLSWRHPTGTIELEVAQRSGELRHLQWTSRAIFDREGRLREFQSVARDLSETRRVQAALQRSETRYRSLFDGAKDALFVYEVTSDQKPGKFIDVNAAACERLGYSREELLKLSFPDITPRDMLEQAHANWQRLLSDKQVLVDNHHLTKTGRRIPVEVNAHLFDVDGRPTVMSIVRDLRKRARLTKSSTSS